MRNPRVPTKSRGKDPEDILYNDIKKSMNTGNRKGERVGVYGAVMSQVYPPRKSVRGLPERGVSRSRSAVSVFFWLAKNPRASLWMIEVIGPRILAATVRKIWRFLGIIKRI